jgi:hypothetical protein
MLVSELSGVQKNMMVRNSALFVSDERAGSRLLPSVLCIL